MTTQRQWPPMIWIGGAQGAGKSTVARTLSRALDLPLRPIETHSRARLALVIEDVVDRGLGAIPAIEGPVTPAGPRVTDRRTTSDGSAHHE